MTSVFTLKPYNAVKHDLSCERGEIRIPSGLCIDIDGSYKNAPTPAAAAFLPEGFRPVFIHDLGTHKHIIAHDGTSLVWARIGSINHIIAADEFTILTKASNINDAVLLGTTIILASDDGIIYLTYDGIDYSCISDMRLPEIQFGLQKAGMLTSPASIICDSSTEEYISSSRPNVSVRANDFTAKIFEAMAKAYDEAVDSLILTKGYFHMPFFIRYAVRLSDGSHIMPSTPTLMTPSVLPPCIGLDVTTDTTKKTTTIHADLTRIAYHELRYRIKDVSSDRLPHGATAIDIFATPMICTYDTLTHSQAYTTTYERVLKAAGTPIRGRRQYSINSSSRIFEGHYSDFNDDYTDHYLDNNLMSAKVMMVRPNTRLANQIASAHDYRLIASLAIDTLTNSNDTNGDFHPLPLISYPSDDSQPYNLVDSSQSFFRLHATSLSVVNGHLIASIRFMLPSADMPLPFQPKAGNPKGEQTDTEVAVYLKDEESYSVAKMTAQLDYKLEESFPRYFYYPDKRAFLIVITQESKIYRVPLTPHPTLYGAYHFSGFEADAAPEQSSAIPDTDNRYPYLSASMILVSKKDNPYVFPDENNMGFDREHVTSVIESTKAPKSSYLGKYAAFAFTPSGIWALEYSHQLHKFISRQKINRDSCISHKSITAVDDMIAYATCSCLKILDGSETTDISASLSRMDMDISALPYSEELLKRYSLEQTEADFSELISCGLVAHFPEQSMLILAPKGRDYSLGYTAGAWSVLNFGITDIVKTNCNRTYLYHDNTVSTLAEEESPDTHAMITIRPIAIDGERIKSVEILGYFMSDHVSMAIYGAHTPRDWHIVSSSESYYCRVYDTEPYRMYTVVIFTNLGKKEYITGIMIEH